MSNAAPPVQPVQQSLAATYAPPFFFTIDRMKQNRRLAQRSTPQGIWLPPHERSLIEEGETSGILYGFRAAQQPCVNQVQTTPEQLQLQEYSTMSVYCDKTTTLFWVVPYDATAHAFVDAEGGTGAVAHHDSPTEDWSRMRFSYDMVRNPTCASASYLVRDGEHQELFCQRPNQRWVKTLLPSTYHADRSRRYDNSNVGFGGMIGDLNLLLALIAFSVKPEDVEETLAYCLCGPSWRGPHISDNHIGRGWRDKRGMVVRIWTGYYQDSTPQNLQAYENGDFGKIFD